MRGDTTEVPPAASEIVGSASGSTPWSGETDGAPVVSIFVLEQRAPLSSVSLPPVSSSRTMKFFDLTDSNEIVQDALGSSKGGH